MILALVILWFCSMKTLVGSHPSLSVSCKISGTYFPLEIKMSCFELTTSIHKKCFSYPRSFISNTDDNFSLSNCLSIKSSFVTIVSSTWTWSPINFPPCDCLKNKVWSYSLWLYLKHTIVCVNFPNYAWGELVNI